MGCLFSLLELLFDEAVDGWFYLMQWIVPEKVLTPGFRRVLKTLVGFFSLALFICAFLGVCALLSDDEYTNYIGKFMVFIPLGISAVQISLGIIFRCTSKKK